MDNLACRGKYPPGRPLRYVGWTEKRSATDMISRENLDNSGHAGHHTAYPLTDIKRRHDPRFLSRRSILHIVARLFSSRIIHCPTCISLNRPRQRLDGQIAAALSQVHRWKVSYIAKANRPQINRRQEPPNSSWNIQSAIELRHQKASTLPPGPNCLARNSTIPRVH